MKSGFLRRAFRRLPGGAWLLLLPWVLVGCKASTARVSGTVYMKNGQPLPGGKISFMPSGTTKAEPVTVIIDKDGKYAMDNAPVGPVQVAISNLELKLGITAPIGSEGSGPLRDKKRMPKIGAAPKDAMKGQKIPERTPPPKLEGKYVPIPEKYANIHTSGLTYEVEAGERTKDFKLE